VPEGLNKPPIARDEEEKQLMPQTILVNFRVISLVIYINVFSPSKMFYISLSLDLQWKMVYHAMSSSRVKVPMKKITIDESKI
jgi:hypothetical protein